MTSTTTTSRPRGGNAQQGNASAPSRASGHSRIVEVDNGKRVDIIDAAQEDGRKGIPPEHESEPGGVQAAIHNHWKQKRFALDEASNHELQDIDKRFSANEELPGPKDVDRLIAQARRDLPKVIQDEADGLRRTRELERSAWVDLRDFKRENGLKRAATYQESWLYHFAFVIILIIVESLANMYFFAQGNELGYLGGFIQAILIAFVNVGVAVAVGYFPLRAIHHRNWGYKVGGILVLLLYFVASFWMDLVVGHYRDILAVDPDRALADAIPSTVANPFGLSFDSMMLLVTSLLAAALGVYKGYTYEDKYPSYGRIHRRYRDARLAYDEAKAALRRQVRAVPERLEQSLPALRVESEGKLRILAELAAESEQVADSYNANLSSFESDCKQWLKDYRAENRLIRGMTAKVPRYFDEFPTFECGLDLEMIEGFHARRKKAQAAHEVLVDKLNSADLTLPVHQEMESQLERFLESLRKADDERELEEAGAGEAKVAADAR